MRTFIAAGWVDSSSIDDLIKIQFQQSVEEWCKHNATAEETYLVDQDLKPVSMRILTVETEDRVSSLQRDYHNVLQAAGPRVVVQTTTHIVINNIIEKVNQHQLYCRMLDMMN